MDFRFAEEEERFREEVRAFLKKEVTEEFLMGLEDRGELDFSREFTKKLAEKGWLAMAWPKEYGGGGATMMEQLIFNEEIGYFQAPTGAHRQGINLIGPTIIAHGTEEQKRRHLRGITAGEVVWCQGFSEPNAGSDLASLQCRAVEEGDDYLITGQKVWTTNAHRADWCHLLARTDPEAPKHRGISYFLVDMKSPGITVRPLINMVAAHDFNEVFLDNVRVPKENMVGDKNQGWYVSQVTLAGERSQIGLPSSCKRTLEGLVEYVKETKRNGEPLAHNPIVRRKLAEMAVEIEVNRMIAYRVAWMQHKGLIPMVAAPASKLFGSELLQRLTGIGMEIMGLYGQLELGSKWAPLRGAMARMHMYSLGIAIAMGTNEIMRNILAIRGLGLPRA
ncbi:MAG: acyl-CoA dehydrogenase family protein [Dehalococcoidia bacterium]|nr:acyl-CoA dehydrogenase family protein [Dehalococcoidia bacterium]